MTLKSVEKMKVWLMVGALACMMGGCTIPGYVAHAITGGPKVPAVYELEDRPTVVFVDDPAQKLPNLQVNSLLAARIGEDLGDHKVLSHVVPVPMLDRLRINEEDFDRWPIDRVGRQVGAAQVIYIHVLDFQFTEDQIVYKPRISVAIKVIDVETGKRLFPQDSDGYPVIYDQPFPRVDQPGAVEQSMMSKDLAERTAVVISQLFYKHPVEEAGTGLN